jgi:hypothetical protein
MRVAKIERVHKSRVKTDIFVPVVGDPTPDLHDNVRGEAAGGEVGNATCVNGLAGCIIREVGLESVEEPRASWDRTIFAQP